MVIQVSCEGELINWMLRRGWLRGTEEDPPMRGDAGYPCRAIWFANEMRVKPPGASSFKDFILIVDSDAL